MGFLATFLGPLPKTELSLMENLVKPLAKSVLILIGLTPAASTADTEMYKNFKMWICNTNNIKW